MSLNSSIVVEMNSILVNDILTNIKFANINNNVQGFKKHKPGKNIK